MKAIINGYNCLLNCIFTLKRVNSPGAGFILRESCLKLSRRRTVCLRVAPAGGNYRRAAPCLPGLGDVTGSYWKA